MWSTHLLQHDPKLVCVIIELLVLDQSASPDPDVSVTEVTRHAKQRTEACLFAHQPPKRQVARHPVTPAREDPPAVDGEEPP